MDIRKKIAAGLNAIKKTPWPPGELLPAFAFLGLCVAAIAVIAVADAVTKKRK
ncbi:MAG: hypothetical protein G01um101491_243 [Parcubacteria group bacterium Gr01-1014_91]|nr:MAG: hypothetical protein G01um101491_243 [Parcubacteria group bacterium Gr01-1014_91]